MRSQEIAAGFLRAVGVLLIAAWPGRATGERLGSDQLR